MRDKVSGAIAIPKASWGCAPALPNRIWVVFLGQAAGNQAGVEFHNFAGTLKNEVFLRAAFIIVTVPPDRSAKIPVPDAGLAHGGGGEKSDSFSRRGEQDNVINLKRLLNGKQNVWKYQNGEEKSDSDGREKDV